MKAVFFDLDGTLIDSAPDLIAIVKQLAKKYNTPLAPEELLRPTISGGSAAMLSLVFQLPETHPTILDLRKQFLNIYSQIDYSNTKLFSGIENVLTKLQTNKISWGIITNKPRIHSENIIATITHLQKTQVTICADDGQKIKPAADGLLIAAQQIGLKPSDCWYIGDSYNDMCAAKSSGMKALIAGWGYIHKNENLAAWNADGYLNNTAELCKMVESHTN